MCRLHAPLVAFPVRDGRWTEVVGVARRDVGSLAAPTGLDGKAWTLGAALVPVDGGYAFASGVTAATRLTLVARDAHGAVLARLRIR